MIIAPGLVARNQIPHWLGDVQLVLETGWTEEELLHASLDFKRKIRTYLNGRARGEAQKARRDAAKKRNR
jgi:hypothetical protein